ncbi:hypothetical protein PSTG_08220 [Puccinia striiformis f. sp. tritici PST-78]|uniref:Uncharacterized protein n=1 Tax=Puccinia striiformis f. sp. tritici PST-78 TaxID=1165861 RepID=A0A0L0VGT4_9BASI|nr:hypothetical protein PSTG_08220 [Puccinia striiformis f. sp. tritici PST-78]
MELTLKKLCRCSNGFTSQAIRARKNRLKELESYLLPLLRQQITNLLKPLHRLRLAATQPCPSLKWILEIQSEIDTTTNQIKDTLNQLRCKESNTSPHNEEDQDRKEFKYFRTIEQSIIITIYLNHHSPE